MMRTVQVVIEQTEDQEDVDFEQECIMSIRGRDYHAALCGIIKSLSALEGRRAYTPKEKKLINDVKNSLAPHFKVLSNGH